LHTIGQEFQENYLNIQIPGREKRGFNDRNSKGFEEKMNNLTDGLRLIKYTQPWRAEP
jgi:hypothetical protein